MTRKMLTAYANDPVLEPWQEVVCDEIMSSIGLTALTESQEKPTTAYAQQTQDTPKPSAAKPIQVRPQLYETLSNTPFY